MFLAIDVGNTQTTIGLMDDGEVTRRWRLKSDRDSTADELHVRLRELFSLYGLTVGDVSAAAIASVVPALTDMWATALESAMGEAPDIVRGSKDCCMTIAMPMPDQVGADRIANAVEAWHAYGAPSIVVDFGTATNIDVVDTHGHYRGGCIAPGLALSAAALFSHAAKLASTPIEVPPAPIGDTTEHAIQSGLVLGVAAQAEGLVARIKAQLMQEATTDEQQRRIESCPIIATGGLSRVISQATDVFDAVDMDLTLRGIWRIWTLHHNDH